MSRNPVEPKDFVIFINADEINSINFLRRLTVVGEQLLMSSVKATVKEAPLLQTVLILV